jgi:hypothetical protein
MVGSACFAVASLPGALQRLRQGGRSCLLRRLDFSSPPPLSNSCGSPAARKRGPGGCGPVRWTISFNVTTFFGMYHHFTAHRPICWSGPPMPWARSASWCRACWRSFAVLHAVLLVRRSATLNLIGSVAFGISAVPAMSSRYERVAQRFARDLDDLGRALCFLWAARILVKRRRGCCRATRGGVASGGVPVQPVNRPHPRRRGRRVSSCGRRSSSGPSVRPKRRRAGRAA